MTRKNPNNTTGAVGGYVAKPNIATLRAKLKYKVETTSTTASGVVPIKGATKYPAQPSIFFTREAWVKQCHLVDRCTKEVGWFALVDHDPEDNSFTITEIVIPNQEVTAAETDIGKEDLADAAMELTEQGKDTSKMYAWFHSHVNMGVSPSAQDEYQVEDFLEDLADQPEVPAFIRGIQNKQGALKLDVYYIQHGVAYQNVGFSVIHDDDPQWYADIDAQIKSKVKERACGYEYYDYSKRDTTLKNNAIYPVPSAHDTANGLRSGLLQFEDDDLRAFRLGHDYEFAQEGFRKKETARIDVYEQLEPVKMSHQEIMDMDTVYTSLDNTDVLMDAEGNLWVADTFGEIYDYDEYTEIYGEIDDHLQKRAPFQL